MLTKPGHRSLGAVTAISTFVLCFLCLRYEVFFQSELPSRHQKQIFIQHEVSTRAVVLENYNASTIRDVEYVTVGSPYTRRTTEVSSWNNVDILAPECENLLLNITVGRWVKKIEIIDKNDLEEREKWRRKEKEIEDELQVFWVKRGIQNGFWREDHLCGYENYEDAPQNSTWPSVGSWCDAKSNRPCCSNFKKGTCMSASPRTCDCPSCVDLRQYLHADVSEWVVKDARCRWRNYSAAEACDVVERSPFSELHFVGDSFMRNMFRTFLMLLTGDTVRGAWCNSMTRDVREKCTEMQQFFWKECRHNILNMSELVYYRELCGGKGEANFTASMWPYYSPKFKDDFYNLVSTTLGKEGTLIIVSVGFHMGCVPDAAISGYLGPAVQAIREFYGGPLTTGGHKKLSGRWPQLVLALPLSIGLLKPTKFLRIQNTLKCGRYSAAMTAYAVKHDIKILDFRMLTKWVHSFDGTHHGINVNLVKNQILLNYIASLK